jgi:alpha-tubulin suppressor-like RCC1 family protein
MADLKKWKILSLLENNVRNNIKFVVVFSPGKNAILVTNDDKVFGFGDNSIGLLGLAHKRPVKRIESIEELNDQKLVDISIGSDHGVALSESGQCFQWKPCVDLFQKPRLIEELIDKKIIAISCGSEHSLLLSDDGLVYGIGLSVLGQLGHKENKSHFSPIEIKGFKSEKVIQISCGFAHSIVLTNKRRVYSFGYNKFGQLGVGDRDNRFIPQLIDLDGVLIKKVNCGLNHSLLLSTDGNLYQSGTYGQKIISKPSSASNFSESSEESNISDTSEELVLSETSEDWSLSDTLDDLKLEISETFEKIYSEIKFKDISVQFSTKLSIAQSFYGKYYVWGRVWDSKKFLNYEIPKETDFDSLHDLIATHSLPQSTHKPIYTNEEENKKINIHEVVITLDNLSTVCLTAVQSDSEQLKNQCFTFVKTNLQPIIERRDALNYFIEKTKGQNPH